MSSGLRINVRETREIREFLKNLSPDVANGVCDQSLESIAVLTEQRAKEVEIVRGRGRSAKPLPKRLSFRSGRLSGSISTDRSSAPKQYVVGSTVAYAPVHELGLRPYPKRPFLEPAAKFVIDTKAAAIFRKALERLRASV
tara:strand:+ start:276 stop:698 length:423 start_codon:yes stop_codon:yes gene_type:complete